jgi:hypothetical protein
MSDTDKKETTELSQEELQKAAGGVHKVSLPKNAIPGPPPEPIPPPPLDVISGA